MKKLLVALFGAALVLGACGGGSDEPAPSQPSEPTASGSFDAAAAEQEYKRSCAACHGQDLQGASGPALIGYSEEQTYTAIMEGVGSMPPFAHIGEEAATNISAWIASK